MACPYFIPGERSESELWTHRSRLPLGDGFAGCCGAPGHEGTVPADDQVKSCNLGYTRCERLPEDRKADAVRFLLSSDEGELVAVQFAVERDHHPVSSGLLKFDVASGKFIEVPTGPLALAIERLGIAFIGSYLQRKPRERAAKR